MPPIDKATGLFFGIKIDSKLREGLSLSKLGDKKYFDGSSEEFLAIIERGEEKWIGKTYRAGTPITEVDDIGRNILSILRRIAPHVRLPTSAVRIFSAQAIVAVEDPVEPDKEDSGPFITY